MTAAGELIALAGAVAIGISKCMTHEELTSLIEFLGLLRHNMEVIKHDKKHEDKHEKKM